jgi:hypothetical protein
MRSKNDSNDDGLIRFIDLDKEVVLVDGERLTEKRAAQMGEDLIQELYRVKGKDFISPLKNRLV